MNVRVVERIQCPKCAERGKDTKGDNLAVYSDGHKFCFSCNYTEFPNWNEKIRNHINQKQQTPIIDNKGLDFPTDFCYDIPTEPLTWLKKYGITDEEIKSHKIGWSEFRKLLVYPVFDDTDQLIMWQGRYFGPKEKHPRYFTKGQVRDILHILGPNNRSTIILVEDLISAIKVARAYPAMPIWGSDISTDTFRRLARRFSSIGVWLDNDKQIEAVKMALRGFLWANTFTVKSIADPKAYAAREIVQLVSEGMNNTRHPHDDIMNNQSTFEVN